jgi:hypothetical protein
MLALTSNVLYESATHPWERFPEPAASANVEMPSQLVAASNVNWPWLAFRRRALRSLQLRHVKSVRTDPAVV